MPISAAQLIGLVSIEGADTSIAKLAGVGASADSAGAKLAGLAVGGTVLAGAGLIALGAAAVKMDADLQQGINRLKTGGGDIQDTFASLRSGIQSVALMSGVLTGPLTDAMYKIVSSGQRGAQAFATEAAAAQGAQIEMANVVDVTQILTTIQTDFGIKAHTAAQYMDGLVKAVSEGKISLEDLSTAMSPILPIAAELGIHFQDVAAAMSVQTNAGLDAARAATGLQAVFVNLENPTAKAAKAMKQFGVDSTAVANEMKVSLPGAFQMLIDAAKKVGPEGSVAFNQAMADMVGGGTRTAKTIDALDQHMNAWKGDIKDVTAAMGDTSKNVSGWGTAFSNLNVQLQIGLANLQTLGQNVGEVLLPYVTSLVSQIGPLTQRFNDWFVTSGREATVLSAISTGLSTLGNVIGTTAGIIGNIAHAFMDAGTTGNILRGALVALGVAFAEIKIFQFAQGVAGTIQFLRDLIPAVGSATVAFGGLDIAMGPIALVIGGIALAAAGATYAFTHWSDIIKQNDQQVGQYLKDYQAAGQGIDAQTETIGGFFSRLGSGVKTTFESMHIGTLGSLKAMVDDTNTRTAQMAADAKQHAQQLDSNVSVAMNTMAANSLAAIWDVVGKGGQAFGQLASQVGLDMQNIDANAKWYWLQVANYIEGNPIVGSISYQTGGSPTMSHFAEGTSYAPGGWAVVGERGPELAYIPQGAQIIPHTQSMGMGAGGSSGIASGQPVQVNIYLAGQRVESVLLPNLVRAIRDATGAKI